ncbi:hypothetical protein [Prosthecomicrobium sp. N25]|uniref:hypothetical protein n=1 Tax=Prosthecomicrobium sp. N25 TaxID=3129254 RepID=UPI00307800E4
MSNTATRPSRSYGGALLVLLALAIPPAAAQERTLTYLPDTGDEETFDVDVSTEFSSAGVEARGPGCAYKLTLRILDAVAGEPIRARMTVGDIRVRDGAEPGLNLEAAAPLLVLDLPLDLRLDRQGRPVTVENWSKQRPEILARLKSGLGGGPAEEQIRKTVEGLDADRAARLFARPLDLVAGGRGQPVPGSTARIDRTVKNQPGPTFLPGPHTWSFSIEPPDKGYGHVAVSWEATPAAEVTRLVPGTPPGSTHQEQAFATYRQDGVPTSFAWRATLKTPTNSIARILRLDLPIERWTK